MIIKFKFFVCVMFAITLLVSPADAARRKHRKSKVLAPVEQKIDLVAAAAEKEAAAQVVLEQPGYIAALGELDAEAQVALALYQTSHVANARTHLSHGDGVVYRRLLNRVLARRAVGFSTELNAFTKAIVAGEKFKSVQQKYLTLKSAIIASRGKGELTAVGPMVAAVGILIHKSSDYFTSGVANGKIVEPSQYQDAWGFMKTAKNVMTDISQKDRAKHAAALKDVDAALVDLNALWPSLTGTETNSEGPQFLNDAAAKIDAVMATLNKPQS